jgi:hypothetical protein
MRHAGFEPAIPLDNVNIFAVCYSHNTTADGRSHSATTLQPAANKYTAVAAAPVPRFRLSTR